MYYLTYNRVLYLQLVSSFKLVISYGLSSHTIHNKFSSVLLNKYTLGHV